MASTTFSKPIDDEIAALNSKIENIEVTSLFPATGRTLSKNVVRKIGKMVEIIVNSDLITSQSDGWVNIGTLPVGDEYRPYNTIDFAIINNKDDTLAHARIESGVLKVWCKANISVSAYCYIVFMSKA